LHPAKEKESDMNRDDVRERVADMMPELLADLEALTRLASIAFPGYPPEPVRQMAERTVEVMRDAGFHNAEPQAVPDGYPPIYAAVPGPEGLPTVMLYAQYDVQPAPPEQGWSSDPWTPTGAPRTPPRPASMPPTKAWTRQRSRR
jgi:acetylornithine deacetylase/succinyl-diaminopimelate desuccinylase-like protein